ncbi:hypothetical protein HGRIS_006755 [Hohenbuehelia grisea]|uniref:Major facilitator superfamily (MFS) profile domain-containing protein n=1 Tax=Hohenbuehelia grisea TaxID=104357 RepID=A0ABR3JAA9_9AGAR
MATFVFSLELSSISTALPVIVNELHGTQFVWVGSAYALAATAWLPLSGNLAQIFGRRPVMLGTLLVFMIGSAMSGAAPSMNFLIAARTIQGIGGGGIASLTQIIVSDLVPLKERGIFNGLTGIAWTFGSGAGPIIGGSLADRGQWRWLFYLNIPICALSGAFVFMFLRLPTPPGTMREKLRKIDWIGNFLVIASTAACVVALTWAGIEFPWSSARVLVPLILGILGLVAFFLYEGLLAPNPMVPFSFLSTRTGFSGYLQTFLMPIVMLGVLYYFPVYFQACLGASPTRTGVNTLVIALLMNPVTIFSGVSVAKSGHYRPQLWAGWAILMAGCGAFSTLNPSSTKGDYFGFQALIATGSGLVAATTYFPVLAPLPVSANGPALALFTFLRNFAQVWGITIGGTILQNGLLQRLPPDFVNSLPAGLGHGTGLAFAAIPAIKLLDEPLRSEVRQAFSDSLRVVWLVLIGIAGAGLLVSLAMNALPLHTNVDEAWKLDDPAAGNKDAEKQQERSMGSESSAPDVNVEPKSTR